MKCEWCGKEDECKNTVFFPLVRFKVCGTCLNHYGNQEYDKIKVA